MEKKRFGPKLKMDGLPKASKAKVKFLTLPIEVKTNFDTGYGDEKNSKWEMDIDLLEHPTMEVLGKMTWQTVAQVIRVEIIALMALPGKDTRKDLEKDWKGCTWFIVSDATGQIYLEEV